MSFDVFPDFLGFVRQDCLPPPPPLNLARTSPVRSHVMRCVLTEVSCFPSAAAYRKGRVLTAQCAGRCRAVTVEAPVLKPTSTPSLTSSK
jgi:hypothetical protein